MHGMDRWFMVIFVIFWGRTSMDFRMKLLCSSLWFSILLQDLNFYCSIWVLIWSFDVDLRWVLSILGLRFHKCGKWFCKEENEAWKKNQKFEFCSVRSSGGKPAQAVKTASQQFWDFLQYARAAKVALEREGLFQENFGEVADLILTC